MLADENYVHLRNGGAIRYNNWTGDSKYLRMQFNDTWPRYFSFGDGPDVDAFNCRTGVWGDELFILDFLHNNGPFEKIATEALTTSQ